MSFLDRGTHQLHYEFDTQGDKQVLVLSNSLGTDLRLWEPQLELFAEHFRLLRYDSLGHGRSSVLPGPYSIEELAEDVVALLDALRLEQVHFCGLSLGGMVGQWLEVNRPGRVGRLVLSNTAAKIGTAEGWNARIAAVEQGGMAAVVPAVLRNWFGPKFQQVKPQIVERTGRMLNETDPAGYTATCVAVRDMDLRADIAHITVPTLILYGEIDSVTPPETSYQMARSIVGSQLVGIPAAHLGNVEAAEMFTQQVLRFLLEEGK